MTIENSLFTSSVTDINGTKTSNKIICGSVYGTTT